MFSWSNKKNINTFLAGTKFFIWSCVKKKKKETVINVLTRDKLTNI